MFKIFLMNFIALFALSTMAATDLIQQFDQHQYSPAKFGLKDLSFEVRIADLDKELKTRFALDKIRDPHFQVYWIAPGRTTIEVMGLPPGFDVLKNNLKKLVFERLEYVVPQEMSNRLRSYEFETSTKSGQTLLSGTDRTHTNAINQIQLTFVGEAQLRSMKTFSPSGSQTAKFESDTKPWSHNKQVVDSVQVEGVSGIQKTKIKTEISYIAKDGFGFPGNIQTTTTVTAMTNTKGDNTTSMNSRVVFSEYQVNTGVAQKHFREHDAP